MFILDCLVERGFLFSLCVCVCVCVCCLLWH